MFIIGDQMVMYYGYAHRSVKWWKRVFFHLLDVSIVNAHIMYNEVSSKKMTQLDFRIAVAKGLTEGQERSFRRRSTQSSEHLRLTERAFPELMPGDARPDCRVCSDRATGHRHQTSYRCKLCKTPLCLFPCFERYHTLVHYKVQYK